MVGSYTATEISHGLFLVQRAIGATPTGLAIPLEDIEETAERDVGVRKLAVGATRSVSFERLREDRCHTANPGFFDRV